MLALSPEDTRECIKYIEELKARAPLDYFGFHPDLAAKKIEQIRKRLFGEKVQDAFGQNARLRDFYNPLHPEVYIIPRSQNLRVLDDWNDEIGLDRINFPFSSTDFCLNEDIEGVLYELTHNSAFWRLAMISQLAYLVYPRDDTLNKYKEIWYCLPAFPHNRALHSLPVAIMAYLKLKEAGFSDDVVNRTVLAIGMHDCATPAGGDTAKRLNRFGLDEEENFSWVIGHHGLDKIWGEKFGFKLDEAAAIVKGQGRFGQLCNYLDRISYVAYDCYYLGMQSEGNIRRIGIRHPTVIDVWQDIAHDSKRGIFYFTDQQRLYNFLLLRAYEHQEFLFNPYSRALDFYLGNSIKRLARLGLITREDLLTINDDQLYLRLEKAFPDEFKAILTPGIMNWTRFAAKDEMVAFIKSIGRRTFFAEHLKGFKTGLNWPVLYNGQIVELKNAISKKQAEKLEAISASTIGYYVYYLPEKK